MTPRAITSYKYSHLRKAIEGALLSGAERVLRAYREGVVRTTWNVGKILRKMMGLTDRPSPENAALVALLCKDLGRPDSFFYDAAKFYSLYPAKPPLALSMAHYTLLIRVEDPERRLALEHQAIREGINSKDFRIYTRTSSRPGLESETGSRKGSPALQVARGRLYHYRAANAPVDGRMLIDIGFGIEHDVRCGKGSLHSGLIVRAQRRNEDYSAIISPYDKSRLYTYAATLVRAIDGDTISARVDLGFRTWKTETFRLRGIDSPKVTCALGQKAKAFVVSRLTPCASLVIKTYKQEKFGRYLADVFYQQEAGYDVARILREGTFLNQELLDKGLAALYEE